MKLNCVICGTEFKRFGKQSKIAKCCSYKCLGKYNKDFHVKESHKTKYKRTHGYFCSSVCYAKWKSKYIIKERNPNFRSKMYDDEGNRIVWSDKFGRIKLHHAVCFEILKLEKIPKGF